MSENTMRNLLAGTMLTGAVLLVLLPTNAAAWPSGCGLLPPEPYYFAVCEYQEGRHYVDQQAEFATGLAGSTSHFVFCQVGGPLCDGDLQGHLCRDLYVCPPPN